MTQSLKILLVNLTISLLLVGCADSEIPPMPSFEICRIVWVDKNNNPIEPFCRCADYNDPSKKASYDKSECNLSLRPGGFATIISYTDELKRRLKKSYRKQLNQAQENIKRAADGSSN